VGEVAHGLERGRNVQGGRQEPAEGLVKGEVLIGESDRESGRGEQGSGGNCAEEIIDKLLAAS
jgi:hypothetical protein